MKNAKRNVLISSVITIVLCISLIAGGTYAWFTDTAKVDVNKVVSGKLDVALEMEEGGAWVSAEGKTLSFLRMNEDGTLAADETVFFEPGATYQLPALRVNNNGNLAVKYRIQITGIDGDAKLCDVIDWTINDQDIDLTEQHLPAATASDAFIIKGHMQESAGNDYQNMSIEGIGITVYATQDAYEYDSTGNQYDANAPLDFVPVGTADELKAVFAAAEAGEDVNVSLTDDITITDQTLMIADANTPVVGDIYIQGNGNTITNAVDNTRCVQIANTSDRSVTITDAKIVSESTATSSAERRGLQIFSVNDSTINLINCDIEMKSNDFSYPVKIGGTSSNVTVNLTGCTLTGANCIESFGKNCIVNITDCVLNSNYPSNTDYCGNGIQDKNGVNNIYNIKNTTFNGTNAQPWQTSATTTINDLGGNVYNTTVVNASND